MADSSGLGVGLGIGDADGDSVGGKYVAGRELVSDATVSVGCVPVHAVTASPAINAHVTQRKAPPIPRITLLGGRLVELVGERRPIRRTG